MHGRDTYLAGVRATFEAGLDRFTWSPLAHRGDRLALNRFAVGGDDTDAWALEWLSVSGIDDEGRIVFEIQYSPGHLEFAMAELDARDRAAAGVTDEPEPANTCTAAIFALNEVAVGGTTHSPLISESFKFSDLRLGVLFTDVGGNAYALQAASLRNIGATIVDARVLAALGDSLALMTETVGDPAPGGFAVPILAVLETDGDGRVIYGAIYDVEDLDRALRDLFARWEANR
jgi:hypothetical protein